MSFTDNFGHPKGFLGKMMLVFMDKEHKPIYDINLNINANSKVALVGPSGAGKSTIAKLIASL